MSARSALWAALFLTTARLFAERQSMPTVPAHLRGEGVASLGVLATSEPRDSPGLEAIPHAQSGSVAPATLDQIAALFAAGDARALEAAWHGLSNLRQMMRDYTRRAPLWRAAPRLDAAFVLDLVEQPLFGTDDAASLDALKLLRRQHDLVRDLGPTDFECAWYRAEMALLQATSHPRDSLDAIRQSLTRCPGDPRLVLGLAVMSDRQLFIDDVVSPSKTPSEAEILSLYDAALAFPQTAAEAGVRSASLAYRLDHIGEAARRLDLADAQPADGFVRYMGHLLRAQVLQKQGQLDRAVDEFRAALVAWPGAQSARVGLLAALMIRGERAEAEALAELVQTAPDDQVDPMSLYWLGDYRTMREIRAGLREMAQ